MSKIEKSNMRVGIVYAKWNPRIVNALVEGAAERLIQEHGLTRSYITLIEVPGSYELPYACQRIVHDYDAVIAVGVLIKGATMHFEYIADAVSNGLMRVSLDSKKPIIFGVLTCLTEEQAFERAGLNKDGYPVEASPSYTGNIELTHGAHNHGIGWADAAVEMYQIRRFGKVQTA